MDPALIQKVARAIDQVQLFSRLNDAKAAWPIEICRYGVGDEPDIVVIKRYPIGTVEDEALRREVSEARAQAAIQAIEAALTKEQEDAIYAAYLGICVLQTMCRKVGLTMAVDRSTDLLKELGAAFPFIAERVAASTLRSSATTQ